jgi:hypothetical protein
VKLAIRSHHTIPGLQKVFVDEGWYVVGFGGDGLLVSGFFSVPFTCFFRRLVLLFFCVIFQSCVHYSDAAFLFSAAAAASPVLSSSMRLVNT